MPDNDPDDPALDAEAGGSRMKAEALIERHIEKIHNQMEKNVKRIEELKEDGGYK